MELSIRSADMLSVQVCEKVEGGPVGSVTSLWVWCDLGVVVTCDLGVVVTCDLGVVVTCDLGVVVTWVWL